MSTILADRIEKPPYFKITPLKSGRHSRTPYVIGFDSEAERGRPFLYQFAHPSGRVDLLDVPRTKYESLNLFVRYLYQHCTRKDTEYLVFGFNLNYEYTQLFRDLPSEVIQQSEIILEHKAGHIPVRLVAMNDKRYSITIEFTRDKRRVKIIDAMAYFPMSLDAASRIIESGTKLPKPAHFERRYRHTPDFEAYAKQDAILTQKLGEKIIEWHELGDVNTCISAPMLACRIFRRRYLRSTWKPMEPELEQYGLNSYHGGKNGYYADKPQQIRDIYNYDIRSAYPEAMDALPCVDHGEWTYAKGYKPGCHALYRVNGRFRGCRFDPIYDRDGSRIRDSETQDVWTTGYELDALVSRRELTIYGSERWEFRSDCRCGKDSSFRRFVADFFSMKQNATTAAEKQYAKLNMNSLYGKLFQKVPLGRVGEWDFETGEFTATDPDSPYDYRAGGLYHSAFASLVTGYVRGKIHHLEHKYDAIMTSTDGFFAMRAPDPKDIGEGLGQLSVTRGMLRIWRDRLYVFRENRQAKPKYALHGFRGKLADLERAPLSNRIYHYRAQVMVTLKLATRELRGERYEPGTFVELGFDLQPYARAGP